MEWFWLLAAEAPVVPDFASWASIPKLITDAGWIGVAMGVAFMFATNRWYSSRQVERLLEKEREITEVWKQNAGETKPLLEELLQSLEPLGRSDAAILKAIEGMQAAQELDRRLRERDRGRD